MNIQQRIFAAAAVVAMCAASASVMAASGPDRGVYTGGARSGVDAYTDGARISNRDGYVPDGKHNADPFIDNARVLDQRSPYTDGA